MGNKKGGGNDDDDQPTKSTSGKGKFRKESMFKNSKGLSGGGAGGRAPNVGKDSQAVPISHEEKEPKETFAEKAREMIKNQRRESRAKTARILMEGSQMKTRQNNTQDTVVPYSDRPAVDDPKCDINPKTGKRWKQGEREQIEAEEKSEKSKFENRHRKKSQAEAYTIMREGDIMKTRAVNKETTVVPYNARPVVDCLNCDKEKKGTKNEQDGKSDDGGKKQSRSKEKIKSKSTSSWANPKGASTSKQSSKSNSKIPEKTKAETNLKSSKNTDNNNDGKKDKTKTSESNKQKSKK